MNSIMFRGGVKSTFLFSTTNFRRKRKSENCYGFLRLVAGVITNSGPGILQFYPCFVPVMKLFCFVSGGSAFLLSRNVQSLPEVF